MPRLYSRASRASRARSSSKSATRSSATTWSTHPVATASLNTIRSVKISVNIESKDRFFDNRKSQRMGNPFNDTTYAGAYWERKIKPQNVR